MFYANLAREEIRLADNFPPDKRPPDNFPARELVPGGSCPPRELVRGEVVPLELVYLAPCLTRTSSRVDKFPLPWARKGPQT